MSPASLAKSGFKYALWVQEPLQKKEEKQLTAATNGNLPWKRRGGATAAGYLSRSLL